MHEDPAALLREMCAIQAQSYPMSKWALGVRLLHATDAVVEDAISTGRILRTHLLRPTWHLVAADDIHWLLDLSAPQIFTSMRSRHRQLGLTASYLNKCFGVIERILSQGNHLTRNEVMTALHAAGIVVGGNNTPAHIMLHAELEQIACSGTPRGMEQTYTLLAERTARRVVYTRDEALSVLAKKYFLSRGPATLRDFTWWSGLNITDARSGLNSISSQLHSEEIAGQTYWFGDNIADINPLADATYLLPAFDEFLISYQDRNAVLPKAKFVNTISNNGVFRPTLVMRGAITGIWNMKSLSNGMILTVQHFSRPTSRAKSHIRDAVAKVGAFYNKEVEVVNQPE